MPVVAKSAAGVMVPWAGFVSTDHVLVSPATPASLVLTLSVPVVASSVAAKVSLVAVGLIAATLIVTVAVDECPEASVSV